MSESLLSPATIDSMTFTDLAKKQNRDLSHLERMDFYRRTSFWVGAVGGIYSFVADKRGYVIGRTIGNGLWGIGWTCWLGFGAVVRADIKQVMDVDHVGLKERSGDEKSRAPAGIRTGTGAGTWALVWRFAAF